MTNKTIELLKRKAARMREMQAFNSAKKLEDAIAKIEADPAHEKVVLDTLGILGAFFNLAQKGKED